MSSVFFADIPETEPIWNRAVADSEVEVRHVGPYVELRFRDGITIDRRSTGTRHAVWYSCLGALENARVVQFDKDALRIVADSRS
ncbi:hypothetical protein [Mycobacterium nebraskense]|uniref:Uncharacterized protein n=1 Tax=Mycobacterium nebraskense TaxID=244292 RepID=A0A0F5NL10_9MYCO|nr:hypothetical protein [Mycobacterium nebraskense]KKC06913.1 hypothetical protein WU83_00120 [Mycobacterium nebraskense]KLO46663.1 hypothetical protein ABW17_02150 [Mycobacterium nebraskense]MBI2694597.1 hypothetical protein [Mycobacterium nebraskense]MCV7118309.1 hypothetical protein [Mycobacterium nebraskense]ORW27047.1 hypothetical protein AWC17_29260 [Mycobacterium nebraskense]